MWLDIPSRAHWICVIFLCRENEIGEFGICVDVGRGCGRSIETSQIRSTKHASKWVCTFSSNLNRNFTNELHSQAIRTIVIHWKWTRHTKLARAIRIGRRASMSSASRIWASNVLGTSTKSNEMFRKYNFICIILQMWNASPTRWLWTDCRQPRYGLPRMLF